MSDDKTAIYGLWHCARSRFPLFHLGQSQRARAKWCSLSDGSVLVIACGDEAQLGKLREWLWQGPRYSRVDNVVEQIYLGQRQFEGFSVES